MTINFNVTGKERKALVQALSELTYSDPVYAGSPTFAYTVGDYTVDKSGVISYPDAVAPEAVALLVQKLSEKGFVPEQPEDEVSPKTEADDSVPEEASDLSEYAPVPVAAEMPDVAPEPEEDAHPVEAKTEATQGAETPDEAADAAEEDAPVADTPEEAEMDDESADDAADTDDTHLTITIPRASLPDDALSRLKQIIANKEGLFKRAVGADAIPIDVTEEKISFPWFTLTDMEGEAAAYAQFISALCQMAREQMRILDKPYDGDNDRFAMRIFMVRLGMKGAQFALARKLMMKNLSGNSGWRYGTPPKKDTGSSNPDETSNASEVPAPEVQPQDEKTESGKERNEGDA